MARTISFSLRVAGYIHALRSWDMSLNHQNFREENNSRSWTDAWHSLSHHVAVIRGIARHHGTHAVRRERQKIQSIISIPASLRSAQRGMDDFLPERDR